jgi:hypothetical protein
MIKMVHKRTLPAHMTTMPKEGYSKRVNLPIGHRKKLLAFLLVSEK